MKILEVNWRDVGKRIRNLRKTKQLTACDFAEQIGIAPRTLSKYENGHTSPNIDFLVRVATNYNVSLDYIVFGVSNEKDSQFKYHILNNLSDDGKKALLSIAKEIEMLEKKLKEDSDINGKFG